MNGMQVESQDHVTGLFKQDFETLFVLVSFLWFDTFFHGAFGLFVDDEGTKMVKVIKKITRDLNFHLRNS